MLKVLMDYVPYSGNLKGHAQNDLVYQGTSILVLEDRSLEQVWA